MKTVRFQYSHRLVPNTPNSTEGKLTLEKIWFEYEGIVTTRVAPYEFKYEYKKWDETAIENEDLKEKYAQIFEYPNQFKGHENPQYSFGLDAWGNYLPSKNGEDRASLLKTWVDQSHSREAFDPACWNLKQINLPSGGEIHVHYEEHTYRYVQDRLAMGMVSLDPDQSTHDDSGSQNESATFTLNLADIGVDTQAEIDEYYKLLKRAVLGESLSSEDSDPEDLKIKSDDYVFFKFLYAFEKTKDNLSSNLLEAINDDGSEYIDGFAYVSSINKVGSKIQITFGADSKERRMMLPRRVCYEYGINSYGNKWDQTYLLNEMNKYDEDINNELDNAIAEGNVTSKYESKEPYEDSGQPTSDATYSAITDDIKDDAKQVMRNFITTGDEDGGSIGMKYNKPKFEEICKSFVPQLSYIRLPLLHDKKGGGIRVKHLFVYDKGLETGTEAIYGSKYVYETFGGQSSGIASNEPSGIRCENPLIYLLKGQRQSYLARLVGGFKESDQEGPVGESLLPSAKVSYSRVITENIHTGASGSGHVINEFYTYKDFPYDTDYSQIEGSQVNGKGVKYTKLNDRDHKKSNFFMLPLPGISFLLRKSWATQGFRFIQHEYDGKIKSVTNYLGDYVSGKNQEDNIVAYQKYNYYKPGEPVKVLSFDATQVDQFTDMWKGFQSNFSIPGKEIETCMAMRDLDDKTMDINIEIDIPFSVKPPFVEPPTLFPSFSYQQDKIATHAMTKIIKYPVILKSVESYKDGIRSKTKNVAFDKFTGDPILTQTWDEHDVEIDGAENNGSVFSFSIPASWMYTDLGLKSADQNKLNMLSASVGSIVSYGDNANPINWIESGSESDFKKYTSTIVNASATTLANNWFEGQDELPESYNVSGNQSALSELNKMYYPFENFIYNQSRKSGENYNSGLYSDFEIFPWVITDGYKGTKWLKTNYTTMYSPYGDALEEYNCAQKIYSGVKYGYKNLLPVIIGQNCKQNEIAFFDFEKSSDASVTKSQSHSGRKSYQFNDKCTFSDDLHMKLSDHLLNNGVAVRFWISTENKIGTDKTQCLVTLNNNKAEAINVAQCGAWHLYEVNYKKLDGSTGEKLSVTIEYTVKGAGKSYVDDVKVQPLESQTTAYVYDPTSYRLLANFNDQHFGTFFQYNSEGKLIRKLIETEEGIKTIEETQYNSPQIYVLRNSVLTSY